MTDLHQLLDRASEHVGSPDLAGRALASAHRTRVRRVAVAALSAVVLVGGGVAWAVQQPAPRADVADTPTPRPTGTPGGLDTVMALPTPPPVPEEVAQPQWDPRTAADLPATDIGLPEVLAPRAGAPELTSIPAAVALVEETGAEGGAVTLVDADGGWWELPLPERRLDVPSYVRTARLSTDGTRVVFLGETSLWSRDVRSDRWREVGYPDGFVALDQQAEARMISQVVPMVAEHLWLARERWWFVDLDTGVFETRPGPDGTVTWGAGDVFVQTSVDPEHDLDMLSWGPLGAPTHAFRIDATSTLTNPVADLDSLAAVRGPCVGDAVERGVAAMSLEDLSTMAYLPIRDPSGDFSCGGALQPLAWLDGDRVLLSVTTLRGPGAGAATLVTWDTVSGELRRVGGVGGGVTYDVARMAVGTEVPVP